MSISQVNTDQLVSQIASRFNSNDLKKDFLGADPYPFIVLDNFLPEDVAAQIESQFPDVNSKGWINYTHVNKRKYGLNKFDLLPHAVQDVISQLHSQEFLDWLVGLTGIEKLIDDPSLEGGGIHQTQRGGHLNIHADFRSHPRHRTWKRQINLLIYFNREWKKEYGGLLELWSPDMKQAVQKLEPTYNRCVIFRTDKKSFHGYADPIQCPDNMSRKSIALYYFTEEEEVVPLGSTDYRSRPGDGIRSLWIWLDKKVLEGYSRVKSKLGLSDDFASKVLSMFNEKK